MKELESIIARHNALSSLFKSHTIDIESMTQQDIQLIGSQIDSALSPENLHCDGEISRAEAASKYKFLKKAEASLASIIPVTTEDNNSESLGLADADDASHQDEPEFSPNRL